jgi:hypothetical protein
MEVTRVKLVERSSTVISEHPRHVKPVDLIIL